MDAFGYDPAELYISHGDPMELAGLEVWETGLNQRFVRGLLRVEFRIAWPAVARSLTLEKMDVDLWMSCKIDGWDVWRKDGLTLCLIRGVLTNHWLLCSRE